MFPIAHAQFRHSPQVVLAFQSKMAGVQWKRTNLENPTEK